MLLVALSALAVKGETPKRGRFFDGGVNLLEAPRAAPLLPPEPWRAAVTAACPATLSWGPQWTTSSGRWAAALSWDAGAEVCVALVRAERDGGVTLTRGVLRAGHSDRYGEDFLPEVLPQPVVIEGHPFPLVTRTTMGGGGGGGAELLILVSVDGGLSEQILGSIGGATNLNVSLETQGRCTDALRVAGGGRALVLDACFDGERQGSRWFDWTGRDFVHRAPRQ